MPETTTIADAPPLAAGVEVIHGDCLEVMRGMADASVDAVVTDPPAGIGFMGAAWDRAAGRSAFVDFLTPRLAEALRLARPGARMLCWAIPRTSHWTGTAIEDAGWIIEDRISHLFGQGFPKAKSKLKPACEDWWLARKPGGKVPELNIDACRIEAIGPRMAYSEPGEPSANTFGDGLNGGKANGTTTLGRWPANLVLSHSEGCREVGTKRVKGSNCRPDHVAVAPGADHTNGIYGAKASKVTTSHVDPDGLETVAAWECVEGCPVAELDGQSGTLKSGFAVPGQGSGEKITSNAYGPGRLSAVSTCYADSGGASRFFYVAKASRRDRGEGNTHPTVKSTDLMRWLCRLITPPGGTILDPFCGSGSTGKAAIDEGFGFVGIESDPESCRVASERLRAYRATTPLFDTGGPA